MSTAWGSGQASEAEGLWEHMGWAGAWGRACSRGGMDDEGAGSPGRSLGRPLQPTCAVWPACEEAPRAGGGLCVDRAQCPLWRVDAGTREADTWLPASGGEAPCEAWSGLDSGMRVAHS